MSRTILIHVRWRNGVYETHQVERGQAVELGAPQPGWLPTTIPLGPPDEDPIALVAVHGLELPNVWVEEQNDDYAPHEMVTHAIPEPTPSSQRRRLARLHTPRDSAGAWLSEQVLAVVVDLSSSTPWVSVCEVHERVPDAELRVLLDTLRELARDGAVERNRDGDYRPKT